jgi:hypothetical protein
VGEEDEDPYGGDWDGIGGWPDPADAAEDDAPGDAWDDGDEGDVAADDAADDAAWDGGEG